MKLLVVLAVVIAVVWLLRSVRRHEGGQHPKGQDKETGVANNPPSAQHMLPCAHCGIHLPGPDMVTGSKGHYCSHEHLSQSEGQ